MKKLTFEKSKREIVPACGGLSGLIQRCFLAKQTAREAETDFRELKSKLKGKLEQRYETGPSDVPPAFISSKHNLVAYLNPGAVVERFDKKGLILALETGGLTEDQIDAILSCCLHPVERSPSFFIEELS